MKGLVGFDKDAVGRQIIRTSILFLVLTTLVPSTLLLYNVIFEKQVHIIWWLQNDKIEPNEFANRRPGHSRDTQRIQFLSDVAFCSENHHREFSPAYDSFQPWIVDAMITDGSFNESKTHSE